MTKDQVQEYRHGNGYGACNNPDYNHNRILEENERNNQSPGNTN